MIKLSDIKDENLKNYLSTINPKILNNSDLVTPETLGKGVVHHIAYQKFDKMVPNISKRAGEKEDNTFLRVHTAPTIMGCITGFGIMFYDILFAQNKKFTRINDNTIYIYTVPFTYLIKPNNKLVYDSSVTDEMWLFSYDADSRLIKPTYTEELKVLNIRILPGNDKDYQMVGVFSIDVSEGNVIELDKGKFIDEGSWVITIKKLYDNQHELVEYKKSKLNKAYLSYKEPKLPVFTKW